MKTNHLRTRAWVLFAVLLGMLGVCLGTPASAQAETVAGPLTLSVAEKQANDSDIPADQEFTFSVELMRTDVDPAEAVTGIKYSTGTTYDSENSHDFTSGESLTLKAGESVTFAPFVGTTSDVDFAITQTEADGWWGQYAIRDGGAEVGIEAQGRVSSDATNAATVVFTNTLPTISTAASLSDSETVQTIQDDGGPVNVYDTVTITGLNPSVTEYAVEGTLVNPATSTEVAATSASIAPSSVNEQSVVLTYENIEIANLGGQTLVATVSLRIANTVDAYSYEHNDLADADQTITITAAPEPEPEFGSLIISKAVVTPKTDEAIAQAQQSESLTDEQRAAQLETLQNRRTRLLGTEFTFTVTLKDADGADLSGEYSYTGSKKGKIANGGTLTLKNGESVTIADLPEGATYSVQETKTDNWKSDAENDNTLTGAIEADATAEAAFQNTPLAYFSLTKVIKNATTDVLKAQEFTFTVEFRNADDTTLDGNFSYTGAKEGTIASGGTITLKGGETVTFKNLEPGVVVRVSEASVDDWTASAKVLRGTTVEGVGLTATFTNTYKTTSSTPGNPSKNPSSDRSGTSSTTRSSAPSGTASSTKRASTPDTGDETNSVLPLVLIALALVLLGVGFLKFKKK